MIDSRKMISRVRNAAKRLVRSESGGALVEMAISSTVVLATFVAVFQLTMACYTYNTVAQVTRESARWAIVRGTTCNINTPGLDHCGASSSDIQDYAKKTGALNWSQCTTSNPCVSVSYKSASTTLVNSYTRTTWSSCTSNCGKPGDMVVVSMNYPYSFSIPFFSRYSLNLSSTSEMIMAQ